jgi:hypothetical protein
VAKIAILWHLSTCRDAVLEFTTTLKRIQQSPSARPDEPALTIETIGKSIVNGTTLAASIKVSWLRWLLLKEAPMVSARLFCEALCSPASCYWYTTQGGVLQKTLFLQRLIRIFSVRPKKRTQPKSQVLDL